jgi:hypothetical protein
MHVGAVALISALATGLVIASALGHTAAQKAAIAALQHRPSLVRFTGPASTSAPAPASAQPASAVSPAPVAPLAAATPQPAGSATPSGDNGATGSSGPIASTPQTSTSPQTGPSPSPTHKIAHVFVISLTTTSFGDAFGATSVARYLNRTLVPRGTLLGGYETLGRAALPDELGMLSGQAPNADTAAGCPTYAEFPSNVKPAADGAVPGDGCVYPNTIITLADQVTSAGKTWKAYIEDMGSQTCVHPNSDAVDNAALPFAGPQYSTRHNPFIYFHSLLDLGGCASNDVSLDKLTRDLRSAASTPALTYLAPRACDDTAASSCPDGQAGGLVGEDAFLKRWVPAILASAAYKQDGLLVISFALSAAGAPAGGPVPTGTLLLSRYAARDKVVSAIYNPYSVLASIEALFGFDPLVHAKGAKTFLDTALPGG